MEDRRDNYSNREIDHFMKDIKETLERIEIQTTTTNGRVSALEKWRWMQAGALAIVTSLLLPIIFKLL